MQRIYKRFLYLFLLIFMVLRFFFWMYNKYDMFIVSGSYRHAVITDGTFVVFGEKKPEDVEEFDVIKKKDGTLARVMSIKNDGYEVVYDDFDEKSFIIDRSDCRGVLLFHANEIGNLYEDYLKPYRQVFLMIPFVLLFLSFFFQIIFRLKVDNEDMEFEYHTLVMEYYNNKYYKITCSKREEEIEVVYDYMIIPPKFHLDDSKKPELPPGIFIKNKT